MLGSDKSEDKGEFTVVSGQKWNEQLELWSNQKNPSDARVLEVLVSLWINLQ